MKNAAFGAFFLFCFLTAAPSGADYQYFYPGIDENVIKEMVNSSVDVLVTEERKNKKGKTEISVWRGRGAYYRGYVLSAAHLFNSGAAGEIKVYLMRDISAFGKVKSAAADINGFSSDSSLDFGELLEKYAKLLGDAGNFLPLDKLLIKKDMQPDAALLKIKEGYAPFPNLVSANLGESRSVKIGHLVCFIGAPLDAVHHLRAGVISNPSYYLNLEENGGAGKIIAVNGLGFIAVSLPGDSGSPLFAFENENGALKPKLIGIDSSARVYGVEIYSGINLATAIDFFLETVKKEKGVDLRKIEK